MTIEEALLYLTENNLWTNLDKSFGNKISEKILADKDLTTKQRSLVARKLRKYRKHFSNWNTLRRKLPIWKQIKVPKEHVRLPRLDYNGKDFLLYVGINQVSYGRTIPKGKRSSSELIWKYPTGSPTVKEIVPKLKDFGSITDEAHNYIAQKLKQLKVKEDQINEVQKIKESDDIDYSLTLKTAPYLHQKRAMKIGTTLERAALLMEQGTGKTLSAIGIATQRYLQGQVKRILIVAPKSVLPEWAIQFKEHTDLPYKSAALDMKVSKKLEILKGWKDIPNGVNVVTINYESLTAVENELIKWKPDMMILDESQKIKESKTAQAKACYRIADKADVRYRLILTGTPVSETPLDFFGQYRFLDPSIFGYSYSEFEARYAEKDWRGFKIKYYKNQEELASKAHSIAYRITKAEANLNLPKESNKILNLPMEESERLLYNEMEETSLLELSDETTITAPLLITQLLRLQQMTGGFIKDEEGNIHQVGQTKLKSVKKLIKKRASTKSKTVIFCRFTSEIEAIQRYLEKKNIGHEVLTGATKDRTSVLTSFKEDPKSIFFLAQIKAGGVGITLTSADMAIFYSTGYSLIDYEQAKARIHRIGQKRPVTYVHLNAKGTIDEVIYKALRSKKDIADLFVDQMKYINQKHSKEESPMSKKLDKQLDKLRKEMNNQNSNDVEEMEMAELNDQIEAIEEEEVEVAPKKKKAKKEKAEKAPKADVVTVGQIAEEIGISPAALRKALRNSDLEKVDGRWEWPVGHADIELVKNLKAEIEKEAEEKAAKKAAAKEAAKKEVNEEAAEEVEVAPKKKKKKKAKAVEADDEE